MRISDWGRIPWLLQSEHGQDLFVETDCDANGTCAGAGNEPHQMIYAGEVCATGGSDDPWFDSVEGECRALTQP
ncbi:MAG TPA: hypothetical protein EYQ66_06415 [Myxococcales bacterium]|nr:hypothetical protein [Myxococcales bacterium]